MMMCYYLNVHFQGQRVNVPKTCCTCIEIASDADYTLKMNDDVDNRLEFLVEIADGFMLALETA